MNIPLSERYRPTELEDISGINESSIERFQSIINEPSTMPSLLFHGPQGTGKTTLATVMINKMGPIDVLRINGSDKTGVDTIRDKVYNFMTSMSSEPDKPKIVWIEEFDYMSQNAYAALRAMMENYIKNARFICTCNYIKKIPDPMISRFNSIEFKKISNEEMYQRIENIMKKEEVSFEPSIIDKIVQMSNGDLRKGMNILQQSIETKGKSLEDIESNEITDKVYNLLLNREWSKLRYELPLENIDYKQLFVDLENKFFNSEMDVRIKANITERISEGLVEMSFSFDEDICAAAICSRIIKELE